MASLPSDASGDDEPCSISARARCPFHSLTVRRQWRRAIAWRTWGSRSRPTAAGERHQGQVRDRRAASVGARARASPTVRRRVRRRVPGGRRRRAVPIAARSYMSAVCSTHQPPSMAPEPVGVRHPGVGQEHLVEAGVTGGLAERPHLDAGLAHGQEEERDAPVLGDVPVGAGDEQPVVGVAAARRPHLLAVHDPLRRRRARPGSARTPGRSRRRARCRAGTSAGPRAAAGAGSAPSARRCRGPARCWPRGCDLSWLPPGGPAARPAPPRPLRRRRGAVPGRRRPSAMSGRPSRCRRAAPASPSARPSASQCPPSQARTARPAPPPRLGAPPPPTHRPSARMLAAPGEARRRTPAHRGPYARRRCRRPSTPPSIWPSRSTTSRRPGASTWRSSAAASGGRTPPGSTSTSTATRSSPTSTRGTSRSASADDAVANPRQRHHRRRRRRARAPLRARAGAGTPGTRWPSASAPAGTRFLLEPHVRFAGRPGRAGHALPGRPGRQRARVQGVRDRSGCSPTHLRPWSCRPTDARQDPSLPPTVDRPWMPGYGVQRGPVRSAALVLGGRAADRQPQLLGRHGRSLRRPPRGGRVGHLARRGVLVQHRRGVPQDPQPPGRAALHGRPGDHRGRARRNGPGVRRAGRARPRVRCGRPTSPSTARRSRPPAMTRSSACRPELVLATPEAGLHHPPDPLALPSAVRARRGVGPSADERQALLAPAADATQHLLHRPSQPRQGERRPVGAVAVRSRAVDDERRARAGSPPAWSGRSRGGAGCGRRPRAPRA